MNTLLQHFADFCYTGSTSFQQARTNETAAQMIFCVYYLKTLIIIGFRPTILAK